MVKPKNLTFDRKIRISLVSNIFSASELGIVNLETWIQLKKFHLMKPVNHLEHDT